MTALWLEERKGSVRFKVRVQPRASRTEIVGLHGDALKVRVAAPPVEGAANAALVAFLAARLRVPASQVFIARGERGRGKILEVEGVSPAAVRGLL